MIVHGYNIKMSDVIKHLCWLMANDIEIFAQNKIFIDSDVYKEGIKIQLSIFAPTWEAIGDHRIILKGTDGAPHELSTAPQKGTKSNGEPGLPGNVGGHFFGVGQHLINANNLTIESIGGNGGPGQNGANGSNIHNKNV